MNLVTAYDPSARIYTVAAQSYPNVGLDTFFSAKLSGDLTSAAWINTNIIVAHPDTAPNNEGSMKMVRFFKSPVGGDYLVTFSNGIVATLDLSAKKYTTLTQINMGAGSVLTAEQTFAHVLDGNVLKSIIYDPRGNNGDGASYLIATDLSVSPAKPSAPLLLQFPKSGSSGAFCRPINAHVITDGTASGVQLAVIFGGNFDMIMSVDETTGLMGNNIIPDMASGNGVSIPQELYCNTGTKDCDYWTNSAYGRDFLLAFLCS